MSRIISNKKVLLRERKRHTARRVAVASACYSGGGEGGTMGTPPTWTWDGVPPLPGPGMGYPPTQTWDRVPPYLDLGWGTPLPRPEMGYPPYLDLRWGTPYPDLRWGTSPLPRLEMGYPPPPASVNRLKILPSPILRMAGGNNIKIEF